MASEVPISKVGAVFLPIIRGRSRVAITIFLDCCCEVTCQLAAIKYSRWCTTGGESVMNIIRIASLASLAFAGLVETAFAGIVAVPGPVAGIGLPALVLIGGAYWVGRKLWGRKNRL